MRAARQRLAEARKKGTCRKQAELDVKLVSSKDVPNHLVQDRSKPMVIVGSDVVSLYPNLRATEAGEEVLQAILESDIKWEGVHWQEAVRYLAMLRGFHWCKGHTVLRRVLPNRKFAHGS